MATTVICDVCETAPALGKVRVSIDVENAVPGSLRTGRMEELDSCEGCQADAISRLTDRVRELLLLHVPAHKELAVLKEEILVLRKRREDHANILGPLQFEADQLAKEQEAAGAEFTDLAKRGGAESRAAEASARLAALNDRGAKFAERIAVHNQAIANIDTELAPLLARRAELHEATK